MAWRLRLHRWRFALGAGTMLTVAIMLARVVSTHGIVWGWGLLWGALLALSMIPLGVLLGHEWVRVYRYEQQVKAQRAGRDEQAGAVSQPGPRRRRSHCVLTESGCRRKPPQRARMGCHAAVHG